MKILKIVGLVILALLGVIVLLGIIAPKELSVSRSIVINAPPAAVFNAVNELPNWDNWSPWSEVDPSIKNVYSEKTSGLGATSTWTSDKSGNGKMTITEIENQEKITFEMEFDGNGGNFSNWFFKPVEGGTETTWDFQTKFPFPINGIMMLQGFEGIMIENYDRGLAKLKAQVEENLPTAPDLSIMQIDFPATRYLVNQQTVAMADMSNHFQTTMPQIGAAFNQNNIPMTGDPVGLYYTWDIEKQTSDMAIGIPTTEDANLDGLTAITLPAGKALQIEYIGDYAGTGAAHNAIEVYLNANNLTAKVPAIEQYLGDPGPESMPNDPDKWMTRVIYLLEE